MLDRQRDIYGRYNLKVALDRGFASQENLAKAKAKGIKDVCFAKKRGLAESDMKIIGFIEEQIVIKQILQHPGLWKIRNTVTPSESPVNIVRELAHQAAPDQGPPDDGFWSQVPNYGYWAD